MSMSLGLGLGLTGRSGGAPSNPVCEAIAAKICISFKDGNHTYLVAPHVSYKGHGDAPYLDAVVIERDGKAPNKPKLEAFKISELADILKTGTAFTVEAGFDASDAKYLGKTICVVQVV